MSDIIKYTGVIIAMLGLVSALFSLLYYSCIKKRYNSVIKQYVSRGLFMRQFDMLATHAGYFGSMTVTIFFWQLLTRKRIRLSRTEYLGSEPYDFIASLPKSETRWIKRYFYLFLFWSFSIFGGGLLMYIPEWFHIP